jgi:hypothetical protein
MSLLDSFDRNKTKCKNCKKYFDELIFADEGYTYTFFYDWCLECRTRENSKKISIVYRTIGDIIKINEQKSN